MSIEFVPDIDPDQAVFALLALVILFHLWLRKRLVERLKDGKVFAQRLKQRATEKAAQTLEAHTRMKVYDIHGTRVVTSDETDDDDDDESDGDARETDAEKPADVPSDRSASGDDGYPRSDAESDEQPSTPAERPTGVAADPEDGTTTDEADETDGDQAEGS